MSQSTSLFKVVNGLRHFGKGCKVTRDIYKLPNTYWIIKDTKLSKDQNHGKVYGQMVWNGTLKPKVEKIGSPLKKEWRLLETPDYTTYKPEDE